MPNDITITITEPYRRILINALAYAHDALMESADREDSQSEEELLKKQADVIAGFMEEIEGHKR
jgi:hypothetical protein